MISCEACGSRKITTILDNLSHGYEQDGVPMSWHYRLLECQECGLGFVNPKPTWEILGTFYGQTYGCYLTAEEIVERELKSAKYWIAKQRYLLVGSKGLQAVIGTVLGTAAELITGKTISFSLGMPLQLSKDARIFELGYGSGYWLRTMSHLGYKNLFGYDIDSNYENAAQLLSDGFKVTGGVFLENDYSDSYFDCIRLEHVFEHLLRPIEVLTKCRNMLKPGGWLLVNSPCKNSWSVRLSLRHFAHLDIPRHLYHHTPKSAVLMLKAAGLDVLKVKPYSVMAVLGATVNNMLLDRGKKRISPSFFSAFAPLYKLLGAITGMGDNITIWARPGQKGKR